MKCNVFLECIFVVQKKKKKKKKKKNKNKKKKKKENKKINTAHIWDYLVFYIFFAKCCALTMISYELIKYVMMCIFCVAL